MIYFWLGWVLILLGWVIGIANPLKHEPWDSAREGLWIAGVIFLYVNALFGATSKR